MEAYTVKQLIKALSDLPQDMYVLDECNEGIVGIDLIQQTACPFIPKDYAQLKTTYKDVEEELWSDLNE